MIDIITKISSLDVIIDAIDDIILLWDSDNLPDEEIELAINDRINYIIDCEMGVLKKLLL